MAFITLQHGSTRSYHRPCVVNSLTKTAYKVVSSWSHLWLNWTTAWLDSLNFDGTHTLLAKPCLNCECLAIRLCLMTKHFPVWTPCLIVFDKIWTTFKFWSNYSFKQVWYRLVTQYNISTFRHKTLFDRVRSPYIWTGLNNKELRARSEIISFFTLTNVLNSP